MSNNCKLGIMQPYFFPYIGYFQVLNAVDKYIVYDDVNYIKRGWINRNYILVNGSANLFNLILCDVSQNKLINEIEVKHDPVAESKLLKTIGVSYAKAPHFNEVFPIVKSIVTFEEKNLALYLFNQYKVLCEYMKISTELILSSSLNKNNSLKGEDKILHICKLMEVKEYYNTMGGWDLYHRDRFKEAGIDLHFLRTNDDIKYKQFSNEFVPNLSVIDVMMFNSVEKIQQLLAQYTLL